MWKQFFGQIIFALFFAFVVWFANDKELNSAEYILSLVLGGVLYRVNIMSLEKRDNE